MNNIPESCKNYACVDMLKSFYRTAFKELESSAGTESQKHLIQSYRKYLFSYIEKIRLGMDALKKLQGNLLPQKYKENVENEVIAEIRDLAELEIEGIKRHFGVITEI
jgi:hypothetical protein